ncbi:MAG: hypothetical protein ACTHMI_20230 [Mucilaginibacter sp.]
MTIANRNIVDAYSGLFEGLDVMTKSKIVKKLADSIKRSESSRDDDKLFEAFGAFESQKSADEIISDIKSSRAFRTIDIKF